MCRKQCSDENGFKCHTNSDSHQRAMRLYSENPQFFTDEFSQEFEDEFMNLMKQKHSQKPVHPNRVYMDLIRVIEHAHMNGTQWTTLSEFVNAMVKKCRIKTIEEGGQTYVQLIDNSPEAVKKRKEEEKKQNMMGKQTQLIDDYVLEQVSKGKQHQQEEEEENNLQEPNESHFQFSTFQLQNNTPKQVLHLNPLKEIKPHNTYDIEIKSEVDVIPLKEPSNIDVLLGEIKKEARAKVFLGSFTKFAEVAVKNTPWLHEGIVVKIVDKFVNQGKLFNKKAVVKSVDQFVGLVQLQCGKQEKIKIDQSNLESVIPKLGNKVMVLKPGPFRGQIGTLESIHQDNFSASIYLEHSDTLVEMPYEYMSKVANEE